MNQVISEPCFCAATDSLMWYDHINSSNNRYGSICALHSKCCPLETISTGELHHIITVRYIKKQFTTTLWCCRPFRRVDLLLVNLDYCNIDESSDHCACQAENIFNNSVGIKYIINL